MDPEDGEICEFSNAASLLRTIAEPEEYDPSLEWPGEPSRVSSPSLDSVPTYNNPVKLRPNQPIFRLLVLRSSILPSKQRIAVVDGYSELQLGRDVAPIGSTTPKLRLKEMEVSKLHATTYWDAARREWGVVDMGSMHGTYLQPAQSLGDGPGTRLSPSRTASIPRKLNHMDKLMIGSTSFLIHLHDDKLPCDECSPTEGTELPLFPVKKGSKSIPAKRPRDMLQSLDAVPASTPYASKPLNDPKKALTMLKQSLLTRHNSHTPHARIASAGDTPTSQYLDRSARRRALRPASHPDSPGVALSPVLADSSPSRPKSPNLEPLSSQPPTPLPTSNIGHRLLMKQGWEPGTALGASVLDPDDGRVGLVEPLEVSSSIHREGLGLQRGAARSAPSLSDTNWKEDAKRKRWDRSG